jgi:MFS family permease
MQWFWDQYISDQAQRSEPTASPLRASSRQLVAWAVTALKRADPLVRLNLLALPGVIGGTVLFLITAATVGVVNLTVPACLEAPPVAGCGHAASVLEAGLDLLQFALAITAAGFAAGRLARRVSPRLIAGAVLGCEAVALGLLAGFHHSAAQAVVLLALFGAGHGGALAAEYLLLTRAVPAGSAGSAAGLASAVGGISGAVASAVTTALLASALVRVAGTMLPSSVAYSHAWRFAAVVAISGVLATAVGAVGAKWRRGARAFTAASENGNRIAGSRRLSSR